MEVVHKENNYAGGYDMEVARGDDEDCVQISSDEDGSEGRIHFSEVVPASVISRNDFSEELPSLAPIFSKPQNKKRPRSPLINSPEMENFPPNMSKADIKKRQAEIKRKAREEEKQRKIDQKQKEKDVKMREKMIKKADTLEECTKWLRVVLPSSLDGSLLSYITVALDDAEIPHRLEGGGVGEGIVFQRVDPRTDQEKRENFAAVVVTGEQLSGIVAAGSLSEAVSCWKRSLRCQHLTLIVWGLDRHFKGLRGANKQNKRLAIETCLVSLLLDSDVSHRATDAPSDVASYVCHLARAVAQRPYKQAALAEVSCFSSWYAESANVCPVKVTPELVGLSKLWRQQLRQFTSVGLEAAEAIADRYPSPALLMEAFASSPDPSLLLADIPVVRGVGPTQTNRKVGKELSRKMCQFFTTDDPDRVLGS